MTALVADRSTPRPAGPPWGASLVAGFLATLEQPSSWAVALAGFLARGGVVAFLLPIVVLPTPAALQTELAPVLQPSVLSGEIAPGLVPFVLAVVAVSTLAVAAGGLVGGWADVLLARRLGAWLGAEPPPAVRAVVPGAFIVRLLAHAPLVVAIVWGAIPAYAAAYAELLTPFEVVTPLVLRIIAAVPGVVALIVATWLLGEAAGGLAVRELVLGGRGVLASVAHGWLAMIRRPIATAATLSVGTLIVAIAIVPGLIAAGTAWHRLRTVLYEGRIEDVPLPLLVFVGLWLGGLVLAAVATAARSAIWTAEWQRRRSPVGTIGGGDGTDRGGWPAPDPSGTL